MDTVEELLQIDVHRVPPTLLHVTRCFGDRCVGSPPRPEAVAAVVERRVVDRLQNLAHGLLDPAVDHGWNPETPLPTTGLRDPHPTNIAGRVGLHEQSIAEFREQVFRMTLDL